MDNTLSNASSRNGTSGGLRARKTAVCAVAVALMGGVTGAASVPAAAAGDRAGTSPRLSPISPPSSTSSTSSTSSHDQLQRDVERALKAGGFVGLSVEMRDGAHRTSAGAGEAKLGTGRPVPKNGFLRAGSATKAFTAVVVLQLAAEGKLSLADPVEKWLPGVVSGNGNDGSRITIRHLLQHTSGIHNYDLLDDAPDGGTKKAFERIRFNRATPGQLVAGAMRHKPDFPPADPQDPEPDWNYSNPNYLLAGMLIEKVTGHDWDQVVRDRITGPLGLRHTYAPAADDPALPRPHAREYQRFPDAAGWTDTTVRTVGRAGAAGSLISTERDLGRFFTALVTGRLLPPEQLAEMRRTVPVSEDFQQVYPGMEYGLGLMRNDLSCGGHYEGHGGDSEGFSVWNGVTADGGHSVVINATGMGHSGAQKLAARRALGKLTDAALCRASARDQ